MLAKLNKPKGTIHKIILIFLLAGSIILMVTGMTWLLICLLAVGLIYWLSISNNVSVVRFRSTRWISYPFYFLTIVFFSIGIRIFLIEIYAIPSVSMEDTILPGDKIIMSKLTYGPRLPSSPFEIPWVNIGFYINKKKTTKADSVWWDYKRLTGFSKVKHGDVVVFNSPKNSDEILIKRCMGLPGDTLLILNGRVFANRNEIPEEGTTKLISRILFNNHARAAAIFDSLGLNEYQHRSDLNNYFSASLSKNHKKVLLADKCIDSIIIEKNRPDTAYMTFPKNNLFKWSIDNFGPLVVPAKGMKILLNEKNYILYNKVINVFEKSDITARDGIFFINGVSAASFTFSNNYYFMLGDNRHDSNDSRYWGFVPDANIIGKPVIVLFSFDPDEYGLKKFRWSRFLKKI